MLPGQQTIYNPLITDETSEYEFKESDYHQVINVSDDSNFEFDDSSNEPLIAPAKPKNADEDWYAGLGATYGTKCEDLLNSVAWQRANTFTYDGLITRLELMESAGLPPMRVIPASMLSALGRIPRSNEGFQVKAIDAVRQFGKDDLNKAKAVIIFFSHRWLRPDWCEELKKNLIWGTPERQAANELNYVVGDPDNEHHIKAKVLEKVASWIHWELALGNVWKSSLPIHLSNLSQFNEVFFWIDWCCVNQPPNISEQCMDMASLPAYVATSHLVVAYWTPDYAARAWCQVELMIANSFTAEGNTVIAVDETFSTKSTSLKIDWVTLPDPASGNLTNERDRIVISSLRNIAVQSKTFSCLQTFWLNTTANRERSLLLNICCLCQCLGLIAWAYSRDSRPGKAKLKKLSPVEDNNDSNSWSVSRMYYYAGRTLRYYPAVALMILLPFIVLYVTNWSI